MAFYRMNGMPVHLKFTGKLKKNPPAQCRAPDATAPDGICRGLSSLLCDAPVGDQGKTCDMPLCAGCAAEVGPDKHLCPKHKAET